MRTTNCVAVSVIMLVGMTRAVNICEVEGFCGGDQCQLYLAPSTIPNAGLGVFTVKALEKGEVVGNGDVSIPLIDQTWHVGRGEDYFWPFLEYVWQGWYMGMHKETIDEDNEAVTAFCPGLDAAINCHAALLNTQKATPVHDDSGLHRSRDPGAGAITPYHNGTTKAREPIPAGGELFKYYGDPWFASRPYMGLVPYERHYIVAQTILNKLETFGLSQAGLDSLWDVVTSMPFDSRQLSAFPKNLTDALQGAQKGIRSLHQPSAIRSIEFLEKEGRCLDNIRPATSTIPGAGRGAFATRFLPEGSIVTGSPLLNLPDRNHLKLYGVERGDETGLKRNASDVIGMQIVLNYCFGHRESTLLVCPYGSGVGYINHNAQQANIRIQFAPNGTIGQRDKRLELGVFNLEWDWDVGLAFDFVATRDILPGEELFLDYGKEWEDAWEKHVENWKPPAGSENYVSARDFNRINRGQPVRTKLEQETDPYPDNVNIWCHPKANRPTAMHLIDGEWLAEERGRRCEVLERVERENDAVYVVLVDGHTRIENVPRSALRFMDVPYTTDLHLKNAFRHEIMLPDDVFPENWRNLKPGVADRVPSSGDDETEMW